VSLPTRAVEMFLTVEPDFHAMREAGLRVN